MAPLSLLVFAAATALPRPALEPALDARTEALTTPDRAQTRSTSDERDPDRHGWAVPDFVRLQSGGFSGMFTGGLGYAAFDDVLNVAALYGYTPESSAGRSVHSVQLLASVRPWELRFERFGVIPIYAGVGGLLTWGDGYFLRLPEQYESGYYRPTSYYFTAHAGVEASFRPDREIIERHALYAELVTLDAYVSRWLENPETLGPADILSLAVGYRAGF